MKNQIIKLLTKHIELPEKQINSLLEIPPSQEFGDYSFPCFNLSKIMKKPPEKIATKLKTKILANFPPQIEKIETKGPYLNFFINKNQLAENLIKKILKEKNNYGKTKHKTQNIMVEFPSPNTNKPLHLGHLRNMSIGDRKSTRLNSSHIPLSRMPSFA